MACKVLKSKGVLRDIFDIEEVEREDIRVTSEVAVGSEYLPVSKMGNGTNEKVHWRASNASRPACVAHARSFLVVFYRQLRIVERPKIIA